MNFGCKKIQDVYESENNSPSQIDSLSIFVNNFLDTMACLFVFKLSRYIRGRL